jgi:glycine/D-amino acid oxidase-like deaminating enzyme
MGALISLLLDAYFTLRTLFKTIATLNKQFEAVLDRINHPPAAPSANPTTPYWHRDPPFPELVDIQGDIPETADVVIVGTGITGAAAARALVELSSKPLKIVVVEARQLCSGATGRNGGHIKCTPYELFAWLRKSLGEAKAAEVTGFYMRHLQVLKDVGEQVPEAQIREVETADLFVDEEDFEKAKKNVRDAKKWLRGFECNVLNADEAKEKVSKYCFEHVQVMRLIVILKFRASDFVIGAISYQAGALWPYRLVTSIWSDLLEKKPGDLVISTHTTVQSVTVGDGQGPNIFQVKTTRGMIASKHVLHATNAYAPYLVPSLIGRLAGFRGHMAAQRPGDNFPIHKPERSWSIIHGPDYEYITQLPLDEKKQENQGLLMVGGALMRSQKQGVDQWGNWDDEGMEALTTMAITGSIPTAFRDWGSGGGVMSAWSGIIGMTGDLMPFVGRIEKGTQRRMAGLKGEDTAAPGQWVAAGYSGEGMISAWLSATAVAIMILGLEDVELEERNGIPGGKLESWFPKHEFGLGKKRLKKAQLKNLAQEFS